LIEPTGGVSEGADCALGPAGVVEVFWAKTGGPDRSTQAAKVVMIKRISVSWWRRTMRWTLYFPYQCAPGRSGAEAAAGLRSVLGLWHGEAKERPCRVQVQVRSIIGR
jgi:hypothetical protein